MIYNNAQFSTPIILSGRQQISLYTNITKVISIV